jgi:hypothetical protein
MMHDPLTIILFPLPRLVYFIATSINGWTNLEKKFHKYLYTGISELKLTNLTSVRQRTGESVC